MSKSIVYFQEATNGKDAVQIKSKFKNLIKKSGLCDEFKKGEIIPVKVHMGEKGNTGYVAPEVVKAMVDKLKSKAAKPFVTDTNVLYSGLRANTVDHLMLASEHGFDINSLGCPVVIADGLLGENAENVFIYKKHFEHVNIARPFLRVENFISIAHVTSHMLTSFAASVKNVGMGCASRAGKLKQHSNIKPKVKPLKCVLCGQCAKYCPADAIIEKNSKAFIQPDICIGCAECIAACKFSAIIDDYGENVKVLVEKMVEYAHGVLLHVKHRAFFNFAINITKNCDCMAKSEPSIVNDIGIFASVDPVACDKAVVDMVLSRLEDDVFQKEWPQASNAMDQLNYAAEIGLGNLDYELVVV
ncbi:MAG: DUF362 domain-containing protein [PVC group bacterium]|nr:DUF362 domain-containing protein [PVC group bacterium]